MQISKCANCGADIDYAAKFCRRCGHPVDPAELTTRKLDEPSHFEAPTRPANSWPTSPAYLPPEAMPPQAIATSGIEPTSQKKTVIALAAVIGILLIALSALAVFMFIRKPEESPRATAPPPPVIIPTVPEIPRPPVPPTPPPPQPNSASGELIYPGARVTMELPGGPKGKVVRLSTPDAADKVIDWYVKKINPKEHVRMPGGNAVLTGDGVAVVITNAGNETSILLTQK